MPWWSSCYGRWQPSQLCLGARKCRPSDNPRSLALATAPPASKRPAASSDERVTPGFRFAFEARRHPSITSRACRRRGGVRCFARVPCLSGRLRRRGGAPEPRAPPRPRIGRPAAAATRGASGHESEYGPGRSPARPSSRSRLRHQAGPATADPIVAKALAGRDRAQATARNFNVGGGPIHGQLVWPGANTMGSCRSR